MKNVFCLLVIALLFFSCSKTETVNNAIPDITITSLQCNSSIVSSTIIAGTPFSGTISVPYTGGNGIAYGTGAEIYAAGTTGLSAKLQAGTLANGVGNLIYTLTGTATQSGAANFAISFAGQSCNVTVTIIEPTYQQYGTPFGNVTNRQDASIYQVNMRLFSAQRNFQGVLARLDSIKALGANVIYLMPIYPVGTVNAVNSPYCIKNYTTVNTEFGTLTDLRMLVDAAHSKNMAVIFDWVANHTAWDHAWTNIHKEWYLQNGAGIIQSPPGTGWNDVAQLNFNNADMRRAMIRNMKYWVYTANIDGYRCDFADGPPADFWKQAIDTLRNISSHKLLLLAEGNRSDHFTVGFDFIFGFNFYGQLKSIYNNNQPVTNLDAVNSSEYTNATNGQQVVRYLSNHDVNGSDGTALDLFGGTAGSMAAFVVTAYMKGVPMIYNGQEVGTPYRLPFPFTGTIINWSLNPGITSEYKAVLAFRNSSVAIRQGALTTYSNAAICAFTKTIGTEKVFVVANFRNNIQNFTIPTALANSSWTNAMTNTTILLGNQINLQPFEYLVFKM